MNIRRGILACFVLALSVPAAVAVNRISNGITIDFTKPAEAAQKATWSYNLQNTPDGLGWDASGSEVREGWIQTNPLAIGLWWQPATAATITVTIEPAPRPIQLPDGQTYTPFQGLIYTRYSPDLKHWSGWQALVPPAWFKGETSRAFNGLISVPNREREAYAQLLIDYQTPDVAWKCDEDAAVKWILKNDPHFFERSLPFVGYVEFLFEGDFHGSQRITALKCHVNYSVSGLHVKPKDTRWRDRVGPWSFKATP